MIYFISDVHLGTKVNINFDTHYKKFINLLETIRKDATHIFLLGDIFDFWYEYFWYDYAKKKYNSLFQLLRSMNEKGIEVHFFIGNHDLWTFGYLEKKTKVILHTEPFTTTLHSKKIYMAHGDGILPLSILDTKKQQVKNNQNYYTENEIKKINQFLKLRKLHRNPLAQFLLRLFPPALGNYLGEKITTKSRLRELKHPCIFKGENKEELILFAQEMELKEHFDYYIFGHRHIVLDYKLDNKSQVILLGDFFQQWTYARLDDNGKIYICNDD